MSSQPNQSLLDGLACLELLAVAGEPVGCRDLGRRLGIHHVRANRLLKSLADAGFAQQDKRRRYRPGPGFHVLAALATHGSGLLVRALPHLQDLARRSAATVALGMLWRDQICYLFHGDARTPAAEALGRTRVVPVGRSSIGHVLLAALPPQERAKALATIPIGERDELKASLDRVGGSGSVCLVHGQAAEGHHHSIAVPIGDPPFAGLACTGLPMDRPTAPVIAMLTSTAALIATGESL